GEHPAPEGFLEPELERHVEGAQPHAEAPELVLDDAPDARALLHDDEGLGSELLHVHVAAPEAVRSRDHADNLLVRRRLEADPAVPWCGADDAELEPPLRD